MKKLFSIFLAFLLICSCRMIRAQDLNADYYRINDFENTFLVEQINELDNYYLDQIDIYRYDIVVCIYNQYSEDIDTYMDWFYYHNDFGYGDDKNGVLLFIRPDTLDFNLKVYGSLANGYDKGKTKTLLMDLVNDYADDPYQCLYDFVEKFNATLNYDQKIDTANVPSWYPDDLDHFERFNDLDAPRIVDVADIFSFEEEKIMLEKINRIQNDHNKDIVVFTDVSTYGMSRGLYAADYHFYNGYGFDDDYTGTILFICMEQGNRGWWTAASGKCKDLYTQEVIDYIDDRLESYMKAGNYGSGVIDYLDNVYDLYQVPKWYRPDSYVRFHDQNASRVVDEISLFNVSEKNEIEKRIKEINEKYDTDLLVLSTDKTFGVVSGYDYGDNYFYYNGYGYGEDYDGMIFTILKNENDYYWTIGTSGNRACYTDLNVSRLLDRIGGNLSNNEVYDGVMRFLDSAEKMYKTGKAPKEYDYKGPLIPAAFFGGTIALILISILLKKMKTIREKNYASEYLKAGSFDLRKRRDIFIRRTITKTARPKDEDKHSGSSGSSFSGGYSSSGGGSYSGGGRSF